MAAEQGTVEIDGKKLNKVEAVKYKKDGLDVWNDIFSYGTNPNPITLEQVIASFDLPGPEAQAAKAQWERGELDKNDPDLMLSLRRAASVTADDRIRFRWYGIYMQLPNTAHYMMRIRIPNGFLTPDQFREIARLTDKFGRGFGDITTRQCIQLHWLSIESFAEILPSLEKVGLVSKFACGDTPRNVVGCPLAGVLAAEHMDATPAVHATNEMFLKGNKEFSNFPRKFKSAMAGCHLHCHQPQINDIGVFGVTRNNPATGAEQRGYGVMVGGGLSTQPYIGQSLRVFVTDEQLPAVSRGIAHIFRDHGYREKRTRARLKYLVSDWGWQKFRDALEADIGFKLDHDDSITGPQHAPHTDHMGTGPQKQPGLHYVGVPIERGRLTAEQMRIASNLAQKYAVQGKAEIRLSNKQNLILVNIPVEKVDALVKELTDAGLTPHAPLWRTSLLSCTGTQFCNLAIVETKDRAQRILKFLETECDIDSPIMISVTGCPNSCSQYQIADIGLMGCVCNFRGVRGTEAYNIYLGGTLGEGAKFAAMTLTKVPAEFIHNAIKQLVDAYKANRTDSDESFRNFVARQTPAQLKTWLTIPEMAEVK